MFVVIKKNAVFAVIMLLLLVVGLEIIISNSANVKEVIGEYDTIKIVVDAGHGEPDGGATSSDGIKESDLNLEIATKLAKLLEESGIEVLMTRNDKNNIADSDKQSSIREIKVSDIGNRIKIANESGAEFLISIHMNKFTSAKYYGWQTFYASGSDKGKQIAEKIQAAICENIPEIENKRTALSISGIKLVDKTEIPAVIVECGFLSNPDETKRLQTEEYQNKMAEGILNGIMNYLKEE